jgi:hypothetical protein
MYFRPATTSRIARSSSCTPASFRTYAPTPASYVGGVIVHREHHHARARKSCCRLPSDLNAVDIRHHQVQHQHIGIVLFDSTQSLQAVTGLPHHTKIRHGVQDGFEPLTHNLMIVGQED